MIRPFILFTSALVVMTSTLAFAATEGNSAGNPEPAELAAAPLGDITHWAWTGPVVALTGAATLGFFLSASMVPYDRKPGVNLPELELHRFASETSGDAAYWFGSDGKFFYVNRAACLMTGYLRAELLQMSVPDIDPNCTPKDWPRVWSDLSAAWSLDAESTHRRRDGTTFPVRIVANCVKLDGRIFACVCARDISQQKEAEQQSADYAAALESVNLALQEMGDAAEASTRSKSEFLANMSHEIRTPMTAILGFSENLLDADLSEEDRTHAIHTIRRNGEYLLEIINDILDVSKIEAGKLTTERLTVRPADIVADVHELMKVRADEKGLQLATEYIGEIPETIQTDPTRVRQILINLIGNAVKFTETGGVRVVTRLNDTGDTGPLLQFDVIDTGIGMSQEQAARLFNPFTQADESTTRTFGGTGLGLTISKRLAQILGGDVVVADSAQGAGTRFRATIATGPLEGVAMSEDPVSTTRQAAKPKPTTGGDALNCRILLAEDGEDNQRLISFVLKRAGAEVSVVSDGEQAVDAAMGALRRRRQTDPDKKFDVILMDMQMPVLDGYEATTKLRQAGYDGPIIALTAHAMTGDREKCLAAGCDEYATKPIDRAKLIATITKVLSRSRPQERAHVRSDQENARESAPTT
jgi:PAS domain S-box-containing protein